MQACINVVTGDDTQALCPYDGPLKPKGGVLGVIDKILATPIFSKRWIEVTTPLGQELGSVEIQAFFPLEAFNREFTIPKMVATLKFPAKETEIVFDPSDAGCLKNLDGLGKCLSLAVIPTSTATNNSMQGGIFQEIPIAGNRRQ